MRTLLLGVVLTFTLAAPAAAQGTATAASWTAPSDAASAAVAQGLIYTLYVNNGVGQVLTNVVCTGTAAIVCQAPAPAGVPFVLDTKFELTAKTATGPEGPRSVPFIKAPAAPTAFRIQ